jgi:hypothetical protein
MRAKREIVLGGEKVKRWAGNYVTSNTEFCPIRKKEKPFCSFTVIEQRNLPYFTE